MRGGRYPKLQMVHLISCNAFTSRAADEVGAALEAHRLNAALARACVAPNLGVASGARAGDNPRALRPRKWQGVGWTSCGQCAAVHLVCELA